MRTAAVGSGRPCAGVGVSRSRFEKARASSSTAWTRPPRRYESRVQGPSPELHPTVGSTRQPLCGWRTRRCVRLSEAAADQRTPGDSDRRFRPGSACRGIAHRRVGGPAIEPLSRLPGRTLRHPRDQRTRAVGLPRNRHEMSERCSEVRRFVASPAVPWRPLPERCAERLSQFGSNRSAGRRCHAIELDPRYAQVTLERWQALTGRVAQVADGKAVGARRACVRPVWQACPDEARRSPRIHRLPTA